MKKILFVCHGNICRSPMAEFVMKDLVAKAGRSGDFRIASAAVSRSIWPFGTQEKMGGFPCGSWC